MTQAQRGAAVRGRAWRSADVQRVDLVAYFAAIGLRLSFIVGVSSSPPGTQSPAHEVNFLICSTRESFALAASTPSWTAARTRSSPASASSVGAVDARAAAAQAGAKSGSRTISAVL